MLGVFVSFAMRISDGFDPRALHQFAGVAQLAEQCFRKAKVVGSSPTIGSIQTYNYNENIVLNLRSTNGSTIKVSIGRAKNVSLQGDCKKDTFGSLKLTAYWWIKWIVRKILGIKVGQSGSSWL